MGSLKVMSLNIKGLNTPEKRALLLQELKKQHVDIAMLQETHFRTDAIPKLQNKVYTEHYQATNAVSKSKGVSILLHRNCKFELEEQIRDSEGRFLFLKGKLANKKVTLVNVYAPNQSQLAFLTRTLNKLRDFAVGMIIMGGDLNCVLNPLIDASNGKSALPQTTIRSVQKKLDAMHLVDSWRLTHPSEKNYTYYSPLHKKHTRIDYIFLTQRDLSFIRDCTIGTTLLSDHSPVSISLNLGDPPPPKGQWKLNPYILKKKEDQASIAQKLTYYFSENNTPGTSKHIIWEAHKCTVRGELISLAAAQKRAKEKEIYRLQQHITKLES